MTDLQASLMVIGGTIVVGVITYNKWQEHKARKSVQKAFSTEHDDVLMKAETEAHGAAEVRHEPSLTAEQEIDRNDQEIAAATAGVDQTAGHTADDASVAAVPADNPAPTSPSPAPQKELPIDELIDCPIALALEAPLRGEKILPKLQALRHVGNKPVQFIGQREDGNWEAIAHGGVYYGLFAGIQLANRGGALNELEYSELITRLRQVADELNAEPDVPDMADVMASARALHQFVAEYDAKLSVNVQSKRGPWAVNTLLSALERHGFDLRPDGRLVMPDGDGGILFSLSTNVTLAAEATPLLTLLLDVPCVSPARDGFGAMTACARMLAARLDGVVVDDGRQPLTDEALTEIAQQVEAFYGNMEAANIPAGSSRALRLFS